MNKSTGNAANLKRKGGTRYPKVGLEKAEKYAKSIASKTHTSPQPLDIIAKGVFGVCRPAADIRLSACRQFGLVDGKNAALQASAIAKKLTAATEQDRIQILQSAFLKPDVFKKIHTGFQGDVKTRAEIKSQFQQLDVHPELTDECTDCFISSGLHCNMIIQTGDKFNILPSGNSLPIDLGGGLDEIDGGEVDEPYGGTDDINDQEENKEKPRRLKIDGKSNVAITLDIDSTMDPEKLAKLVKILKDNGLA